MSANSEREARFDAHEDALRARFEELGQRIEDGWVFDQPTRVTVLCKERRADWDLYAHARGV